MDSYQQSEPGQFPLKDGDINGSGGNHPLSCTTPLKDEPKSPSKNYPGLRYEDFTPPVVTDGREVRLEVSSKTSSLDDIYSLGKAIKILSCLDGVYILLSAFYFWSYMKFPVLSLLWGPVAGFIAGENFNIFSAKCYVAFYICKIVFSAFSMVSRGPHPK